MAQFEKGQSGNPGGRPKSKELRALCKEYTERAVNRLGELLDYNKSPMVQLTAARELLDRAWGRPVQASEVQIEDGRTPAERMTPAEVTEALATLIADAERQMGLGPLLDATDRERVQRILDQPGHLPPGIYSALHTSRAIQ